MAKEPVVITLQRDLAPQRPNLIFSVGSKQHTLELYPRIKVLGTGPAPVLGKRPPPPLKALPVEYMGERHTVIVQREPTRLPYVEWCEFEERPGPAPDADSDNGFTVYLTPEESGS